MELLKVLAMPFQMASLLFVAVTSVVLGLIISAGWAAWIIAIFAIWSILVWLTNYALRMIDDAANGVREAGAASWEMMSEPALDARCWVHPVIGLALWALHTNHAEWPVWPTLLAVALIFPASLGASIVTGHARDALHPGTMLRVMRGLGPWYALPVVVFALSGMLFAQLARHTLELRNVGTIVLTIACLEMLVLFTYAVIGGVLYERRLELGFEPRVSPERVAMRENAERNARRQHLIDEIYRDLRVREAHRAVAKAQQWLAGAEAKQLPGDVHAILAAGRTWGDQRDYPRFLQGLLPVLFELKQPALACTIAETGLAMTPGFTTASEADVEVLVGYAFETGRRRTAQRLIDNYLKRTGNEREPSSRLLSLRDRLQSPT